MYPATIAGGAPITWAETIAAARANHVRLHVLLAPEDVDGLGSNVDRHWQDILDALGSDRASDYFFAEFNSRTAVTQEERREPVLTEFDELIDRMFETVSPPTATP